MVKDFGTQEIVDDDQIGIQFEFDSFDEKVMKEVEREEEEREEVEKEDEEQPVEQPTKVHGKLALPEKVSCQKTNHICHLKREFAPVSPVAYSSPAKEARQPLTRPSRFVVELMSSDGEDDVDDDDDDDATTIAMMTGKGAGWRVMAGEKKLTTVATSTTFKRLR